MMRTRRDIGAKTKKKLYKRTKKEKDGAKKLMGSWFCPPVAFSTGKLVGSKPKGKRAKQPKTGNTKNKQETRRLIKNDRDPSRRGGTRVGGPG